MKTPSKIRFMARTCLFLLLATQIVSCGEEGIGFNVRKDFPVDVPILIEVPDPGDTDQIDDLLNVNPPSETFTYDLNQVGAFDDALEGLQGQDNIILHGVFYEVTGVDATEEVGLDQLEISVEVAGSDLVLLDIRTTLTNVPRTSISLSDAQRSAIVEELFRSDRINSQVVFDLSELPANNNDLTFNYLMYFDVELKARDL